MYRRRRLESTHWHFQRANTHHTAHTAPTRSITHAQAHTGTHAQRHTYTSQHTPHIAQSVCGAVRWLGS